MQAPNFVRPWLNTKPIGLQFILFSILLSAIVQFAAFAMSQNFVLSAFGAQPEDITLSLQLSYIGILVMLPIHFRLIRYLELRSYLISALAVGMLLNVMCYHTTDILLFCVLRFFQGNVVCAIAGSMLIMISNYLKMEHKRIVGPTIFYGTILSSSVLIGLVFANVTIDNDWKDLYGYLIAFQVAAMILVMVTFSARSGQKRYPLYQIDWIGTVFFAAAAVSLGYMMIYGSKY